ncbi:MAG: hypothetical protein KDB06_05825 [Ilumatobacter sp.]|nr:hypothetical protein [Ilumatobacter sp.]MCB0984155.1 hypothetical protein [Ilumatobacter sp.]
MELLRSVGRQVMEHHAAAATVLSVALFGYARLTVALMCWPMGIAPSDLELSFQDYLLIAAFWLVFLLLPFGAIKLHGIATRPITDRSTWPWHRRVVRWLMGIPFLAVVFVVAASSGTPWSPTTTLYAAAGGFVVLFVVAFAAAWAIPLKAKPIPLVAGVLTVFIAISGCVLSWSAGSQLADGPANHRPVPLPLQLVLAPSLGVITLDGAETCVIRVAPRVYVSTNGVVVTEVLTFKPEDCIVP